MSLDIPCFPGRLEDDSHRPLGPDQVRDMLRIAQVKGDLCEVLRCARYLRLLAFRGIYPEGKQSLLYYSELCDLINQVEEELWSLWEVT